MAQKIAAFPTATRRSKYDVDRWFDGDIWKLSEGEDFTVPVASLRGSLYNQAHKKGFNIQTSVVKGDDGKVSLVVQKIGLRETEAPAAPAKGRKAKAAA